MVFHRDHDSITYLINKPDLSGRVAWWVMLLQEFQYTVEVKPGKQMTNADFLSPLQESGEVMPIPDRFSNEHLFAIGEEEEEYQDIHVYLETGEVPPGTGQQRHMFVQKAGPCTLRENILFRLGADFKLWRCLTKGQVPQVLSAFHSSDEGGHFKMEMTLRPIREPRVMGD